MKELTSPEAFAEKMQNIPKILDEAKTRHGWDEEDNHKLADHYMCELLAELGYGEGVAIFESMSKWYS